MPAQHLGIKENNVKVITVDSVTGEIVNRSSNSVSSHSPTASGDSVDGSIPSDFMNSDLKAFDSLQAALDNFSSASLGANNSDASIDASSVFSDSTSTVSSLGDGLHLNSLSSRSFNPEVNQVTSSGGGTAVVPQVFRIDTSNLQEVSSLLGKRSATSLSQNSLINKVIITKNASSQPHAVPIHIQTVSASTPHSTEAASSILFSQSPRTPTKTITISQQGLLSPMKGITMTQVVGTPPKLPISKLPVSPAKTPTKITMIPVSMPGRSPIQRHSPLVSQTIFNNSASSGQTTITMSPSKVIKQPGTVHLIQQKPIQPSLSNATVVTIPARTGAINSMPGLRQVAIQPGNIQQQIHVPGTKFQYIRLANPATSTSGMRGQVVHTGSQQGLPSSLIGGQAGQQMKITIPAVSTGMAKTGPTGSMPNVQRIILPATQTQIPIRPSPATGTVPGTHIIRTTLPAGTGNISQQLAALSGGQGGTTIISTGGNNPAGVQGFALVPASYLSQIQQQIQVKPVVTTTVIANNIASVPQQKSSDYVPIASSNPAVSATTQGKNINGSTMDASGGARPRKPCNCTKSQCLKLYCDCFANGEFCHNCNCMNCSNNLANEEERSRAIKSCLDRNPLAFHPKIGKGRQGEKNRQHNKGCNCKRSGCLKNYCECYEAKIMCSSYCKCVGCKNFEESPERKTLMHLADAAEVRVLQQTAAKSKLSSQISDLPSRPQSSNTGERLPFSFVTNEVVEATCACLLAQGEEADRQKMPAVIQERMVIEEFGRCLLQIIESANRTKGITKAPDPDPDTS